MAQRLWVAQLPWCHPYHHSIRYLKEAGYDWKFAVKVFYIFHAEHSCLGCLKNWSVKKCKILALISPLYDYSKYPIKLICQQASFLDILGQKSIF